MVPEILGRPGEDIRRHRPIPGRFVNGECEFEDIPILCFRFGAHEPCGSDIDHSLVAGVCDRNFWLQAWLPAVRAAHPPGPPHEGRWFGEEVRDHVRGLCQELGLDRGHRRHPLRALAYVRGVDGAAGGRAHRGGSRQQHLDRQREVGENGRGKWNQRPPGDDVGRRPVDGHAVEHAAQEGDPRELVQPGYRAHPWYHEGVRVPSPAGSDKADLKR
mmetsp:Transcript_53519/g.139440  ORF Transcript_53519/g.139440 Transcript_53519/m.139440 type:complete len:216 (+) Transcript_53519:622-1269(+)